MLGLSGEGMIYRAIKRSLERDYQVLALAQDDSLQQLAACELVIFCSDTWSPGMRRDINRRCLQAGTAQLSVSTRFGEGIVGPCVMPNTKGCTSCADLRQAGATSLEADRELLHQVLHGQQKPLASQPWLSSFSLDILTTLAGEEIAAYLQQRDRLRTICALLVLSLTTLECRRHAFLPHSACPACGELRPDSQEEAVISLHSRPKTDALTYRTPQPSERGRQILTTYVDEQTGLVPALEREESNLLPIATSHLSAESDDDAEKATGTGSTFYPEQSKLVAVLEVLERYAGLRPRGKRTMVKASYRQLLRAQKPALDPVKLGLHSAQQYEAHRQSPTCHGLVEYDHNLVCHWVWGYSFQRQGPVLVPEHCAYYGVPASEENPAFVFDVSNGCALGNSLEEAIFHGILEVTERDAFLLTWYARLPVPRLDLASLTEPTLRLLIEHLEYQSGYTVQAFNITLDHPIPCLFVIGIDEQKRDTMPRTHVVAGSHPHPEHALQRALCELAASLAFPQKWNQQSRAQALALLENAELVRDMDDHPLVYYLPEAFERFNFLTHTPRRQTFQQAFHDFYTRPPKHMDLRDDLVELLHSYLKRGMDVIVVEQTAPEHRVCGLCCVKVIIPGMLPMTFGQQNRRVTGFERLHQLPFTLGYLDHPLKEAEINPYPHPFF